MQIQMQLLVAVSLLPQRGTMPGNKLEMRLYSTVQGRSGSIGEERSLR